MGIDHADTAQGTQSMPKLHLPANSRALCWHSQCHAPAVRVTANEKSQHQGPHECRQLPSAQHVETWIAAQRVMHEGSVNLHPKTPQHRGPVWARTFQWHCQLFCQLFCLVNSSKQAPCKTAILASQLLASRLLSADLHRSQESPSTEVPGRLLRA